MSIRSLIEALVAKGVDTMDAAEIVTAAALEGARTASVDKTAEKRRAYDRKRKQEERQSPVDKADIEKAEVERDVPPNPPEIHRSPVEPKQMRDIEDIYSNSNNKQTIPQRASYPPDFEELWTLFPRKVGKDDAFRSWKKVRGRIEHDALKTAISKHAALVAGKEKQFIPHPATWLNDGRWQDEELQPPKPLELVSGNSVFVMSGTPQWDAWARHRHEEGKRAILNPVNGGWWYPSEWPPDVARETPAMRKTG